MAKMLRGAESRRSEPPSQPGTRDAKTSKFSLADRLRSFGFAIAGLVLVLRSQHNAWIHALATLIVLSLGVLFPLSGLEWSALIIAIALVWGAEAMNTAIELLGDAVSADHHPVVGQAKDAAAGAVLVAALAAAAVGFIVLGPHCLAFLIGVGIDIGIAM
jgi:diacylglycerol kinase (ATP)